MNSENTIKYFHYSFLLSGFQTFFIKASNQISQFWDESQLCYNIF